LRGEDWVTTIAQLSDSDAKLPVFQLADVIEDIDAFSNTEQRFQNYLQFPIRGADAILDQDPFADGRELFVVPTWNVQFTKQQIDAVRDGGGCWLIVRGDSDYAVIVPGILEQYLKSPIEFKFLPNENMSFDEVHLIRVRTLNDPDTP